MYVSNVPGAREARKPLELPNVSESRTIPVQEKSGNAKPIERPINNKPRNPARIEQLPRLKAISEWS
jgi:hypothetical protein